MGLRLTSQEDKCAMFDSVSGFAFGPIFNNEYEATSFLRWCEKAKAIAGGDIRHISLRVLDTWEGEWSSACDNNEWEREWEE